MVTEQLGTALFDASVTDPEISPTLDCPQINPVAANKATANLFSIPHSGPLYAADYAFLFFQYFMAAPL
jgi:hypothetical protein